MLEMSDRQLLRFQPLENLEYEEKLEMWLRLCIFFDLYNNLKFNNLVVIKFRCFFLNSNLDRNVTAFIFFYKKMSKNNWTTVLHAFELKFPKGSSVFHLVENVKGRKVSDST